MVAMLATWTYNQIGAAFLAYAVVIAVVIYRAYSGPARRRY